MGLSRAYHLWWWRNTLKKRSVLTEWNYRHNAIFIHIPKTAGTSVLSSLGAPEVFDTHAPGRIYRQAYPAFFEGAYRFTFVRNPWDRFASSFHFMRHGTEWQLQRDWADAHIGELSFGEFTRRLKAPMHRAAVMAERFFWPQTAWLDGAADTAHDVFRFEALGPALDQICARLGLEPPPVIPQLRKVHRADFRDLYDDETRDIVGRIYRRDVEAFGYRFSD
jgi:hypothetical protein